MRILTMALMALFLSGCSQSWDDDRPSALPGGTGITAKGKVESGSAAASTVSTLPARDAHGLVMPFGSQGVKAAYEYETGYKVGVGDRLSVRVLGEPELTTDYLVDGSGQISMPYLQTVNVGGMTAPDIQHMITLRLGERYLRSPQVSVQVTTLRPFFILGEVTTAGSFSYQPGMTVQNAIAIAGGYTARADENQVLVTRRNSEGTKTFKVPVTTQLYPGDVVYIRQRWF